MEVLNSQAVDVEKLVNGVSSRSVELIEVSERIHALLAGIKTETSHTEKFIVARQAADHIQKIFEGAVSNGTLSVEDVFDIKYQEIPHTDPRKYHTKYDAFADQNFPAVQEAVLAGNGDVVFAGAVDINGYFPTHNKKFSQPLSGNYQKDLANNRTKRIFNDRTGKNAGSNTSKFLLQTYMRDTGEVLHDLSVPIYVRGRHWGGFRIGYLSKE